MHFRTCSASWMIGLLGLAALASCSGAPVGMSEGELSSQDMQVLVSEEGTAAQNAPESVSSPVSPSTLQRAPQLVKSAAMTLELKDVDAAVSAISNTLGQYQGDLLHLSDQDTSSAQPRQVSLQLRVPQENLDPALEAFRELGTVTHQSITAEDVSTQLVDLQARVRNLRKSEEALREIMDRSGSIAEVLEVAQELSTVREAIERHEAQLKNLQNRVAYSTISLTLVSTAASPPSDSPVGEVLSQTWQSASAAMKSLSVSLLQLSIWLLAFSPYIGILVVGGWLGHRYWRTQCPADPPANS